MIETRPIGVDLFAGAGGMSLGFEQAGFDVLASVEIDPVHCATHKKNFPFGKVFCEDAAKITGGDIRYGGTGIGDRDIDVVFGGSPCQGFSLQGNRETKDSRNNLALHFIRLVQELRPKYFVFENVKGLMLGDMKVFLEDVIIPGFEKIGYEIAKPYMATFASSYGVAQNRERLFLLGTRKGEESLQYPDPWQLRVTTTSFFRLNCADDAIGDLPAIERYRDLETNDTAVLTDEDIITGLEKASSYALVLKGRIDDPLNFYSSQRIEWLIKERSEFFFGQIGYMGSGKLLLTNSMRTKHSDAVKERFANTPQGKIEPTSRFPKLNAHQPARTLLAGTGSEKGSHTAPRPIHYVYPRCITVREAARLHSYPDWFLFHPTIWHGFRQVGNSVPPMMARAMAMMVLRGLGVKRQFTYGDATKTSEGVLPSSR